ncbi:MAG: class I SAM-dependent methyltransferase [Xanthobacteraceae bacterium]
MAESSIRDLGERSHLDALLATVGPVAGLHIIDVGCGEGQLARALANRGARVTGCDPFIAETGWTTHGSGSYRLLKAPADALSEPDQSADLVLFVFSLHHVPEAKLYGALAEARRVLRPSGRLYVAEPLAQGPHQHIMELFHDETAVRKGAANALVNFAKPHFAMDQISSYTDARSYSDFDTFAGRMIANMRFNGYTEAAVLAPDVRRRFVEANAKYHGKFDQPVRIDYYCP